ncbi:Predicted membrane protein [Bordetella ansorpii]|uniref:Predicted membrane protein n=1 Tax=Bordetella ansorpii TaxID=288768 RepID=A0A157PMB5_9BORD|nr:DUF445 domain-containing protein [Bordetella ansorpii]SAI34772.1 Predicted membrane protein [Bordetella ansorpii]
MQTSGDDPPKTISIGLPPPGDRERKLRRKKRSATLSLLGACLVFVVLTALDPGHQNLYIGALAAMAEAAMVGGLADWFAVTALFRHPLGLRWLPHTAIIPRNKDRIGASLADFICDHFLGKEQVLERLHAFDPAQRLVQALSRPESAARLADFVVRHAPRLVALLDSDELQDFIRANTKEKLSKLDVSDLLARLLTVLTKDGRHQEAMDRLLRDIADIPGAPSARGVLAQKIAEELWSVMRWVRLDKPVAENIADKVAAGMRQLFLDMARDKDHELRVKLERNIPRFIAQLRTDPALRARIDLFRDRVLENHELSQYIQDIWRSALDWLREDLAHDDSEVRAALFKASLTLGKRIDQQPEMKAWFNGWVTETVEPLVEEYREKIRRFIVARVQAWSAEELTSQLELNLGSDLQSIRLSGTFVGALIGGLLYGLMHLVAYLAR